MKISISAKTVRHEVTLTAKEERLIATRLRAGRAITRTTVLQQIIARHNLA